MKNFSKFCVAALLFAESGYALPPRILMNLFILTADLSKVTEADLDRLRSVGAAGFELPGTVSTPEDCRRLGSYLRKHGMYAALNVAVDQDRDPSSEDPTVRKAGIDYLLSRIDCASDLGATILAGPISLPWGHFPDKTGQDLKAYLDRKLLISQDSMRNVSDYAKEKGIKLALEPLTHWEMPGLNTLAEAMAFVSQVNHPNFGLTLDPSHEVLDGAGPAVFFQQLVELERTEKLFFVQVSAPHRGDLRTSWMPWTALLDLVVPFWTSPISIEIMNAVPPFAQPNGCGLRLARLPFEDPFQVAGANIELVKEKWQAAQDRLGRMRIPPQGFEGLRTR